MSPLYVRKASTEHPKLPMHIVQYVQSQHIWSHSTDSNLSKWKIVFQSTKFYFFFCEMKSLPWATDGVTETSQLAVQYYEWNY